MTDRPVSSGASRARRGELANLSGQIAEAQVIRSYQDEGAVLLHHRWRQQGGEIDLIFQSGAEYIFVEVKKARSITQAAERLGRAQMDRICRAALEYCATRPDGENSQMRFDVALIDSLGQIKRLKSAFGAAGW